MSKSQTKEAANKFEEAFSGQTAEARKNSFDEAFDYMKNNSQAFDSRDEMKALSNQLVRDGYLPQVAFAGLDSKLDVQSVDTEEFSNDFERRLEAATAESLIKAFSKDDWDALSGGDGDLSEKELDAILAEEDYKFPDGKPLSDQQRMALLMLKQTYETFDNNSMWSDCDYDDIQSIYNERKSELTEQAASGESPVPTEDDKAFQQMDEFAKVKKGEGFYQSAERLLGPDADEAEVKALARRLKQDWMEKTGKGYQSLGVGEELLTPEYLAELCQDFPSLEERYEELSQAA